GPVAGDTGSRAVLRAAAGHRDGHRGDVARDGAAGTGDGGDRLVGGVRERAGRAVVGRQCDDRGREGDGNRLGATGTGVADGVGLGRRDVVGADGRERSREGVGPVAAGTRRGAVLRAAAGHGNRHGGRVTRRRAAGTTDGRDVLVRGVRE